MMEAIGDFFNSFESADWAVLITAFFGAIVSIALALKSSKDQAKWNKQKIDADLTAKARIDWIQNVREHTAELFAAYYGILKETDKKALDERMQEAKKHSDILILYFGDLSSGDEIYDKKVLSNRSDNAGKNSMMVTCISTLFDRISQYSDDVKAGKLEMLENKCRMAENAMYEYPIGQKYQGVYVNEEGEECPCYEPLYDPVLEKKVDEEKINLNNYKRSIMEIHRLINELRDYMRLYLKIEWDIAKSGK